MANKVTCIGKIKCPSFPVSEKEMKYLFQELFNLEIEHMWSNSDEYEHGDLATIFEIEFLSNWSFPEDSMNRICQLLKGAEIMFVSYEHSNDYYASYQSWSNNETTDEYLLIESKFQDYLQITRNI